MKGLKLASRGMGVPGGAQVLRTHHREQDQPRREKELHGREAVGTLRGGNGDGREQNARKGGLRESPIP